MQPLITAVRAVGVEFVRRTARPLIIIVLVIALLAVAGGAWLTTLNAWWWILEAVLIVYALLSLGLIVGFRMLLRLVEPPLSSQQRKDVGAFVDKLERTSEHVQTPQPLIIFRIVRDIIRRNGDDSFIASVSRDTRSLAPDFVELQRSFNGR